MPELPEVEITVRRLDAALRGARVESALAPGMNVMKTFEPPLDALAGREFSGIRRIGKMPVVELGDLALLIHLMSAGRLRVFEKRASPTNRALGVLLPSGAGRRRRPPKAGRRVQPPPATVGDQPGAPGEAASPRGRGRGRDGHLARAGGLAGA